MKKSWRITVYSLMVLAVVGSLILLLCAYILKCPFNIPVGSSLQSAQLRTFEDGRMLVETSAESISSQVLDMCVEGGLFPEGVTAAEMALVFAEQSGSGLNEMYINLASQRFLGAIFSFKCLWSLSLTEGGVANASLSDFRLGVYQIPVLGEFFWRLLNMPENLSLPTKNGLLYLSDVDVSPDGSAVLTYEYSQDALVTALNAVLKSADERKLDFHRGAVDTVLLTIAEAGEITAEEAVALVKRFEKNPETFRELCYLLSDEGIEMLYSYFGGDYYKHVGAAKLSEASRSALDGGLNEFNARLSQLLLQYLYNNQDYVVKDGALYLRGSRITPETVLSEKPEYNVEIYAERTGVKAVYDIYGDITEKTILSQTGE